MLSENGRVEPGSKLSFVIKICRVFETGLVYSQKPVVYL